MPETTKAKIRQLFQFLKEANQLRFRPIRNLNDQIKVVHLADIPEHSSIKLSRPTNSDEVNDDFIILSVKRPLITKCPEPPEQIHEWILSGWDHPDRDAYYEESRNFQTETDETITVKFVDDITRLEIFNDWVNIRDTWRIPEIKSRRALLFFESFYDVYSTIEKDTEDLELVIADGNLFWRTQSSQDNEVEINHPIILKRVELRFNPNIPEFTIHDTQKETELYTSLFVDLEEISPNSIRQRSAELQASKYHPFGWEDTEAFLRATIQTIAPTRGEYLEKPPKDKPLSSPRLFRYPVLILRKRTSGISTVVDKIVENIDHQTIFPPSLSLITGSENEWKITGIGSTDPALTENQNDIAIEPISDDDILLAKEANEEQIKIIRTLDKNGSVVVQGPPGTGKTHTIGNLIGHLLSQGKTILITAQTVKALRVLRDKIPEKLQPLAVSVLGSDQDSRRQLEISISAIAERLTLDSPLELEKKARVLEKERSELISNINILMHKRREALENEYKPISVGSKTLDPAKAARFVSSHADLHGWIPGPVKFETSLPLTSEQFVRLYALNGIFTLQEERDALLPLPEVNNLPTEQQFSTMIPLYEDLTTKNISIGDIYWTKNDGNSEDLSDLFVAINNEFSSDRLKQAWRPHAIMAGIHLGTEKEVWELLIQTVEATCEANAKVALGVKHRPILSTEIGIHRQLEVFEEICIHFQNGGKIGLLQFATRSEWKKTIKSSSVAAGEASHLEHFVALRNLAKLEQLRLELEPAWDSLIGQHINTPFSSLGENPELSCRGLLPEIKRCLDWHSSIWLPLEMALKEAGLRIDELYAALPRAVGKTAEYIFIEKVATFLLPRFIEAEINRRLLKECEFYFSNIENLIATHDISHRSEGCIANIISSCRNKNIQEYSISISYAKRLIAIRPLVLERQDLLDRLAKAAPVWSENIKNRLPPHDKETIPGDPSIAWEWIQFNNILSQRDALNAQELQSEIDEKRSILRTITENLIDAKSWSKQLKRLQDNDAIRRALVGWKDTTNKLISTRQSTRRNVLISEARKLMNQSSSAVPAWIMPISIMAEHFDPSSNRFDVAIIDEASQADLNGLIPLYFANKTIIVGDHEQVTPLGVGQEQTILNNLRSSMLRDIPNSHLFDNMVSIYDIARQSFGSAIRLVEHFRCVPEIISFSNKLSYEGKIKPLRESDASNLTPSCVSIHVNGIREDKINRIEARRIVDYIKAMILHPAYEDKSIGIISMLGEPQARHIQSMIYKEISGIEITKRRIQAGTPSEFQGDERDVILLSMVDSSPNEGLLRMTSEGAFELNKKRYNVAASRARDQLWMIHSFEQIHLKNDDLRNRLLQHIQNPKSSMDNFEQEAPNTESPFEKEVLKILTSAGFKVRTQWQVGYYRIDMVVEGNGKRLAVECDGDRYHPIEKLSEDMERQSVLERLGWKFARIRGSAFFRDPDKAMKHVFEKLDKIGILPGSGNIEPVYREMTLINELDQLILEGIELIDEEDQVSNKIENNDKTSKSYSADSFYKFLRELLLSYNHPVPVEDLCKVISLDRGYKRMSNNLRRKIEIELRNAERNGIIKIHNGSIELAQHDL